VLYVTPETSLNVLGLDKAGGSQNSPELLTAHYLGLDSDLICPFADSPGHQLAGGRNNAWVYDPNVKSKSLALLAIRPISQKNIK
jgi:hypothetical protein